MTSFRYLKNGKEQSVENLEELIKIIYSENVTSINDDKQKKLVSKYMDRVPLYDIKSNHVFLIDKENVYQRIFCDNYRFIDGDLEFDDSKYGKENKNIVSFYDLKTLFKTYTILFYESFISTNHITSCKRPSFAAGMRHIKPYYDINEINYLAIDYNLIKKITIDKNKLTKLCSEISLLDIDAKTLVLHEKHISESNAIGLVKYYSLQGSYFVNQYLRAEQRVPNNVLDRQIYLTTKLINEAPAFQSAYTVYRFIDDDFYLAKMKIGDEYVDNSFMSTTRNPFYYNKQNPFGTILIKINLPKNIKGIGLCIESYSNFPIEEEIILPPTSRYRLDEIDVSDDLKKFQEAFRLKVTKKYMFTYVGNDVKLIEPEKAVTKNYTIVDFDKLIDQFKKIPNKDKMSTFMDKFIGRNRQFMSAVNGKNYIFNFESYSSIDAYKQFFKVTKKNGIMINTINQDFGNINLLIELDADAHVNYYFKYSVNDDSIKLDDEEWLKWLMKVCFVMGRRNVIIYPTYLIKEGTRYIYSKDVYEYLKNKIKFYNYPYVTSFVDYLQLDHLFSMATADYIKIEDKNELYRISKENKIKNLAELYLFIVDNYPNLIQTFEEKMDEIVEDKVSRTANDFKNPITNVYYSINPWQYFYDANVIDYLPSDQEFKHLPVNNSQIIKAQKIPKFLNRLREFAHD